MNTMSGQNETIRSMTGDTVTASADVAASVARKRWKAPAIVDSYVETATEAGPAGVSDAGIFS